MILTALLLTVVPPPALAPRAQLEAAPKAGRVVERPAACRPVDPAAPLRLDFDGSTVRDVAREVGRVLCKNFVLDPGVADRRVFLVSASEVRADALWPAVLSALAVSDVGVIDRGPFVAMIPATDGTRADVPRYGVGDAIPTEDRLITKVLRVKDGDVLAMANYLGMFKSPTGQVHASPAGRALVVTDFASSVARLEWLLGQVTEK